MYFTFLSFFFFFSGLGLRSIKVFLSMGLFCWLLSVTGGHKKDLSVCQKPVVLEEKINLFLDFQHQFLLNFLTSFLKNQLFTSINQIL